MMHAAGIEADPHATAKGLRHGYGVHAIGCGVPLNLLSRCMGHASLEVTATYADALGVEEQGIAVRMWYMRWNTTMEQSLRERVEEFIATSADIRELHRLLDDCTRELTLEHLMCVRRLFEDDYGGFTYNFEMKAPAAYSMICWGRIGVDCIVEAAVARPSSKNNSLCTEIMATIASGSPLTELSFIRDSKLSERVELAISNDRDLSPYCRSKLVEFFLSFEDDDYFAHVVGHAINKASMFFPSVAKEIFRALSARWMAVSKPVLAQYENIISKYGDDETAFQDFLTRHPQLLDPMAAQMWPKPDLYGAKEPDFIIRRSDNSYLIVEIEKPNKLLVTGGGQLSADVTQAEKQASDYRTFLMRRFQDTYKHFPLFDEPDCLVVIGLERELNTHQKEVLANANHHRHRLRIVGFDWLAQRAAAIAENTIQSGVEVKRLRVT